MSDVHARGLERNTTLYPWYRAGYEAYFWLPVFFLYFNERFSIERVLQLEAIYFLSVVLLEVPSGYFSDRIGRRPTLLIEPGLIMKVSEQQPSDPDSSRTSRSWLAAL